MIASLKNSPGPFTDGAEPVVSLLFLPILTSNKNLIAEKLELNNTMMIYTSAINATVRDLRENHQH
jgi:hypothetical protein